MANLRDIRRRIKSVKNTRQITKAMELVAASKMKKAQQAALAGRAYAGLMAEMLAAVAGRAATPSVDRVDREGLGEHRPDGRLARRHEADEEQGRRVQATSSRPPSSSGWCTGTSRRRSTTPRSTSAR